MGGPIISRSQLLHLAGMVAQSVPADISAEAAQDLIDNPEMVRKAVRNLLSKLMSPWRELLYRCGQDSVHSDFNYVNFPLEETTVLDEAEWEPCEHNFSEVMRGRVAFQELEKSGYRLCGPRRAMEFIAAHSELQRDHEVVITTRWKDQDGIWYVPVFDFVDGKRIAVLSALSNDFTSRCGWIVLRRKQK